jgi:ferric-dicitrate binding protein FerR (iron transport regulator)
MTIRPARLLTLLAAIALIAALSPAAPAADYSHARIVRLSQVQGEVKVARQDSSAASSSRDLNWEEAVVNLPIREGHVLATGNGRAVIEFENGAVAYLAENSVLQFTELALSDGARVTALDLMQGTDTFYANPASADSFVVRSPSVEVKLARKGRFRLDVYDDGSAVGVQQGQVDVTPATEPIAPPLPSQKDNRFPSAPAARTTSPSRGFPIATTSTTGFPITKTPSCPPQTTPARM